MNITPNSSLDPGLPRPVAAVEKITCNVIPGEEVGIAAQVAGTRPSQAEHPVSLRRGEG